jgi:type I restriction enzyme M protein
LSRPFDEARYRGLLEGLEITELALSDVRKENDKLRIDSGYFAKPMLAADRQVRAYRGGCDELGSLFGRFAKGVFDINAEAYAESGVPFLRILNLRSGIIDDANLALIPESVHEAEKKTELLRGEIVLSKTAYPAASVVTLERCNTSQDTIATSLCEYGKRTYTPEALVAYLNSSLGERLLWRQFQGNVQLHLSLDDGRKVPVPRLGMQIQEAIASAFDRAQVFRKQAISESQQAEQTLLRALGLENWQPPEPLAYTRPSRDAFAAGRLDSEHFKPKYAELEQHIQATKHYARLEALLAINERGTQPDYAESGLPVVNSKHVANGEVRLNDDNRVAIAGRNALKIKQGDVLMNGTGVGTIGRTAPFLHDVEALPDNHVTVLRSNAGCIDPVYLSVYLNSLAGQYQVNKWLRGSSGQIELYPNDIAQFLVWIAPERIQQSIRKAVNDAFTAKHNATRLLDAAKRAVEIAIESCEAGALEFLNREITPQ